MALTLEIVTPDKKVYSRQVNDVVLPTRMGEIDVLPGHLPLITMIEPGEVVATGKDSTEHLAVDKGFARVQGDVVSILTEAAIDVEAIDLSAVAAAKERAEASLKKAREENWDPSEIERLEAVTRFALVQQLTRAKKKR